MSLLLLVPRLFVAGISRGTTAPPDFRGVKKENVLSTSFLLLLWLASASTHAANPQPSVRQL